MTTESAMEIDEGSLISDPNDPETDHPPDETASLIRDLERRIAELEVLRWLGQAVNFTLDFDDLLELIYTQTSRVIDTTNFYIAQVDPEKAKLCYDFAVEARERIDTADEQPVGMELADEVVRTQRPIRTTDYVQECRRRGLSPRACSQKAWMGVPLNASDRVIGVMVVASDEPTVAYSDEQQEVFCAVADQAAAMIEKAHLYREMEQQARELAALNEVSSLVTSTLNLQDVLRLIMDKSVELLRAEAGSLVLVDQGTGELVFEMTAGPGSPDLVGTRLPAGTGIIGTVAQEGISLTIRDAQTDRRWYRGVDERTDFVSRSIVAVPMSARGRVIGVIELLNRRDGGLFDTNDERLLSAFAAHAAIAIENAQLFTQTDQALAARVEELSTMQRIDRELNATLDYERVMHLTLDWATRTTGADAGLVAVVTHKDGGGRELSLLAQRGYSDEILAGAGHWSLEHGPIAQVMHGGEPVLLAKGQEAAGYTPIGPDMVEQLIVPIRREAQMIGVILLESRRQGCLDQEALASADRLVDHAAIAIDNARLFDQVRLANDAKTEFISFVSHELKQPMTSIKGYVDLLIRGSSGPLTDMQYNFLETVRSNVDRMADLVADLLQVSRLESGRLRLELEGVPIGRVIEIVLATTHEQLRASQHGVEVNLSAHLPPVKADQDRLTQILMNLVSNANKYTPAGGLIEIQATRWPDVPSGEGCGRFVCCSVRDTGIGISPEDQKLLFTKYFRADDPAVRSVSGTGLGLVITKSLVELHGGEIWVDSQIGQGSTFSFTVPTTDEGT